MLTIGLVLYFQNSVFAQLSLGAQFGKSASLVSIGTPPKNLSHFKLGIRGDYQLDDSYGIIGNFQFHMPKQYTDEAFLSAYSSSNSSSSVNTEEKLKGIKFNGMFKYYFKNTEYDDDFGLYFLGGGGLSYYWSTERLTEDYDKEIHYLHHSWEDDDTRLNSYAGFTLNAGIGTEFRLGDGYLFGELKILLPAQLNDSSVDLTIPTFFHFTAGYRFTFD